MSLPADLDRLYDDYPYFVADIWKRMRFDRYHPIGEIEADMCSYIAGGPRFRGILGPRGIGKTTFGTCTYAAWRHWKAPSLRIIVPSKSTGAARKMLKLYRSLIFTVDYLRHLAPKQDTRTRIWRDNTDMIDLGPSEEGKDPSLWAVGIEGQIENARADLILPDDVETKENTETSEARNDLSEKVKDFVSLLYPNGEICYFGTYHHEQSLYLELANRGFTFRTWPLLYPRSDEPVMNLAPLLQSRLQTGEAKPGDKVYPYRHDDQYVAERQGQGRRYFLMQHMLVANLGNEARYPLRLEDLIVFPVERDKAPISIAWGKNNGQGTTTRITDIPAVGLHTDGLYGPIMFDKDWAPYQSCKAFLDPAGRGDDEMALAAVAQLNGRLYAKELDAMHGGATPENIERICLFLRRNRVTYLMVERNFGGDFLIPLLESNITRFFIQPGHQDETGELYPFGWACSLAGEWSTGQKEPRIIDALEPVMGQHRLVVSRDIAADRKLQEQLTRITRERNCLDHDDRLEALSRAVRLFQIDMRIDPTVAAERQREKMIDDELKSFNQRHGVAVNRDERWFARR